MNKKFSHGSAEHLRGVSRLALSALAALLVAAPLFCQKPPSAAYSFTDAWLGRNPALAGSFQMMHRSESRSARVFGHLSGVRPWFGHPDLGFAPQTSVQGDVADRHGWAADLYHEERGPLSLNEANAQYRYGFALDGGQRHRLNLGIGLSLYSAGIDFSHLVFRNAQDPLNSPDARAGSIGSHLAPGMGAAYEWASSRDFPDKKLMAGCAVYPGVSQVQLSPQDTLVRPATRWHSFVAYRSERESGLFLCPSAWLDAAGHFMSGGVQLLAGMSGMGAEGADMVWLSAGLDQNFTASFGLGTTLLGGKMTLEGMFNRESSPWRGLRQSSAGLRLGWFWEKEE